MEEPSINMVHSSLTISKCQSTFGDDENNQEKNTKRAQNTWLFSYSTAFPAVRMQQHIPPSWELRLKTPDTSILLKHTPQCWLSHDFKNNYSSIQQASVTLQNMMWWMAAGTQKLLQCTPNINNNVFRTIAFFASLFSSDRQNLIRKVCLFIIHNGRRHSSKNIAVGWIRTGQWPGGGCISTLISANSCNKHTIKLYNSTALTLV